MDRIRLSGYPKVANLFKVLIEALKQSEKAVSILKLKKSQGLSKRIMAILLGKNFFPFSFPLFYFQNKDTNFDHIKLKYSKIINTKRYRN